MSAEHGMSLGWGLVYRASGHGDAPQAPGDPLKQFGRPTLGEDPAPAALGRRLKLEHGPSAGTLAVAGVVSMVLAFVDDGFRWWMRRARR